MTSTLCNDNCPTTCLAEKMLMRDRIEELEKQVPRWVPESDYNVAIHLYIHNYWQGDTSKQHMMLILDRPIPRQPVLHVIAHPNQSIGEKIENV